MGGTLPPNHLPIYTLPPYTLEERAVMNENFARRQAIGSIDDFWIGDKKGSDFVKTMKRDKK